MNSKTEGIILSKKRLAQKILFFIVIGVLASLFSHFIIEMYYYNHNYEHVKNLIFNVRTELFLMGSAILFILYSLFSFIFGSSIIGSVLLLLLSWTFGVATKYKSIFRSEPLYPNELYMVRELPFLLEMIDTKTAIMIVAIVVITIGLLIAFYYYIIRPRREEKPGIQYYVFRILGVLISAGLLFYVVRFNYPENKVKAAYDEYSSWALYNQNKNYSNNGFIAGFLSNLPAPPMNEITNYSKDTIRSIYEKYADTAESINQNRKNEDPNTNIIFVMNESFSDPFNLEGIESNKDPLKNYREIIEESVSGSILAPSIGGGTATNEFQVLTGLAMEPFAPQMSSPFIQLTKQMPDLPVITNRMKDYNYKATAVHPYTPTFYRRSDTYRDFNFDEFRHQENMKHREQISEQHRYISDFAAYQEVFDVLEETEENDFIHLVTIQNHMPYANKYDNVDYEVTGSGNDEEAAAYFKDLENSDISLRLLINKIDRHPEPILLLFWGDHLPGFYEGDVLEKNDYQTMQETPFLIYSNEVDLKEEIGLINPIYLNNYVFELLDMEATPYQALLYELEKQLPVFDGELYYDKSDQMIKTTRDDLSQEALEVLEDYSLLMYDITTGNHYADELGFFEL